jgi:alkylation response protein AidB-like acyl-CoA dehydrogenase
VDATEQQPRIMDIFEGTEQIQQLVISRAISGLRIE